MKPKFIWFDLGYTLVYMKREQCLRNALLEFGPEVGMEKLEKAYHMTDKLFMREYPGVLCKKREEFMPLYFEKLLDYLRIGLDVNKALSGFYIEEEKVIKKERLWFAYEKTVDVLSMLKHNGIGTGLISNWDGTAREVLRQNGLDTLLDVVVVSAEAGCCKPDEAIFRTALDRAGVEPCECLYVGDNYYDDVLGSGKVRMDSLLINPYGREGIEEIAGIEVVSNISGLPGFLSRKGDLNCNQSCNGNQNQN